jgi:amino acid permease
MADYDEKKYAADDYTTTVAPAIAADGTHHVLPDHDSEEAGKADGLKRQLKSRHLAMISIGGGESVVSGHGSPS